MKKLTYPLTGALVVAACAILVACGGGGSSSTPATAAPTSTTAPTTAPTAQATTLTATTGNTTVNLGGVSSGGTNVVSSASVSLPTFSASTNASLGMQATLPAGGSAPAYRTVKGRDLLGLQTINPLVYFTIQVSSSVTITDAPGFTVTAPSTLSGQFYVGVFDVDNASHGWNLIDGPVSPSGATVTFPASQIPGGPFSLVAGDTYIFCIFSATATPTPSPTPTASATPSGSPTPTPTATPTPGGTSPLPNVTPSVAGFGPYTVATQFQFPVQSGYNGAGQTVVILGDNTPATSDVNAYLSAFGITSAGAAFSVVDITANENGTIVTGPGTTDTSGLDEATLDIETVAAMAPGANIEFYGMPDLTGYAFTAAYTQLTNDTHATVMSASFGGCEYGGYSDTTQDPLLAQAEANGVIMFASSGDQGNECYGPAPGPSPVSGTPTPTPSYAPGVNYPASDPNVVGVGGQEDFSSVPSCPTQPTNPSLTGTAAWNDCFFTSGQGASGGGVSAIFTPRPSYQSGLGSSATARNVPDIAMPAEDVAIVIGGSWYDYGGTSWSAPLAAAEAAEINEYCFGTLNTGSSKGVARFYTADADQPSDFMDLTSGNNQWGGATTPYYTAASGYDNVTGLGIPLGLPVAQTLCPSHAPALRSQAKPALVSHTTIASPIDGYGAARDTSLGFVPHRGIDMGERGSSGVGVILVMRATSTLATDEQHVVASLQNAGFTVTKRWPNHLAIEASAPATTVERYFQTSIHNMNQGNYGMRYANVRPVVLPASIASVVHGAIVDNLVIARWFHHRIVPLP